MQPLAEVGTAWFVTGSCVGLAAYIIGSFTTFRLPMFTYPIVMPLVILAGVSQILSLISFLLEGWTVLHLVLLYLVCASYGIVCGVSMIGGYNYRVIERALDDDIARMKAQEKRDQQRPYGRNAKFGSLADAPSSVRDDTSGRTPIEKYSLGQLEERYPHQAGHKHPLLLLLSIVAGAAALYMPWVFFQG